jgi:hypothetical protein
MQLDLTLTFELVDAYRKLTGKTIGFEFEYVRWIGTTTEILYKIWRPGHGVAECMSLDECNKQLQRLIDFELHKEELHK